MRKAGKHGKHEENYQNSSQVFMKREGWNN